MEEKKTVRRGGEITRGMPCHTTSYVGITEEGLFWREGWLAPQFFITHSNTPLTPIPSINRLELTINLCNVPTPLAGNPTKSPVRSDKHQDNF